MGKPEVLCPSLPEKCPLSALFLFTGDEGGTRPISEFLSLGENWNRGPERGEMEFFSNGLHAENEQDNNFNALCSSVLQDQGGLVTKVSW